MAWSSVGGNFCPSPSSRRLPTTIANGPKQPCRCSNSHLAHGSYLCAAQPTIADLFCYGDVAFAELCGFDLKRWGNLAGWTERVTALPGFKAPFALLAMENAEFA